MKKLLVISILLCFSLPSCNFLDTNLIKGNGIKIKESRSITSFESLDVSAPIDVSVVSGDDYSFIISGDENHIAFIDVGVSGSTLTVSRSRNNVNFNKRIEVIITIPSAVKSVAASSMAKVVLSNSFDAQSVSVTVADMSSVDIDSINTKHLSVAVSDMSRMSAIGEADRIEVDCSDMSNVDFSKLTAKGGRCDCSDMSNIVVDGANLTINSSGMSSVKTVE